MKSYKQVIKQRYNNEEKDSETFNNVYSLLKPTGFFINKKIRHILCKIFNQIIKNELDISKAKILDVGCGYGIWTRFYAEIKKTTKNIYGIDLSLNRIKNANLLNPNIKYFVDDINDLKIKNIKFDLITAINIFSHLNTKEEIINSLKNIYKLLNKKGFFLWYDIYCKDHFKTKNNIDASGFNKRQIINFCNSTGFKMIYYKKIFKNIFWKFHSAYLFKNNFSFWFVELLEKIMPGSPGNMIFLFKKKDLF